MLAGIYMLQVPAAHAIAPADAELAVAARWAAARFNGVAENSAPGPGLYVLANNDPVQLNARNGRPMRLVDRTYARGLYCHANSRVIVRLPSPAREFLAVAGVDSNEQTSGGRGSVSFAVLVEGTEVFRSGVLREGMEGVPVAVPLSDAREFVLQVYDAGDGISCDQADWAEARVTLQNGRTVWLADLPLQEGDGVPPLSTAPPFSFVYGGRPFAELGWQPVRTTRRLDDQRTEYTLAWTDTATGLVVQCLAIQYLDFPTLEWTVYFENTGTRDTPILSEILALDAPFHRRAAGDFVLHHHKGTFVRADDFEPLTARLKPGQRERFTPPAGRPCGHVWPYFNLEAAGEGAIVVVGWPGQWTAEFARDPDRSVRITAGQEKTHLRLKPGERIRTPLIALQFYQGDWLRAQNLWRRWMVAHGMPRPAGQPPRPLLTPCSSHQFAEMIHANEANQKLFIDRYLAEGLAPDYWWMDAGWYVNKTGWPNTGTWLVDSNRFPGGLRAITDHAHAKGVKSLVWFEPERVTPGTWLHEHHPEWLLQGTLLNLGNAEARTWLTDHIDQLLTEQGIDLYRQDYNIDPLKFWRANDPDDRQGATENHYVTGYLAYWDELRRRHPDMLIDSCASGGHRNDLETLRRALPFLRSDFIMDATGNQAHTYGLSFWLPYFGTGSSQTGEYDIRSAMATPHFIACWDMRNPALDYDLFRRIVRQWREFAPNYLGDYYPLTPYTLNATDWIAWQFDRPEAGRGMIQAFRRPQSVYEVARFRLTGLDREARYTLTELDSGETTSLSGLELMETGVPVAIKARPGTVVIGYGRAGETRASGSP